MSAALVRCFRIALLHLAPKIGDLPHNRDLFDQAFERATSQRVDLVISPEMWLAGYSFANLIGSAWITPQPDEWLTDLAERCRQHGTAACVSYPERDPVTAQLFNSAFVIDRHGSFLGAYRKRNVIPGAESWAERGTELPIFDLRWGRIGVMVCADAASPEIASGLTAAGAEILVSPAAWAPGEYGPAGEWEACSRATGIPVFVCNRGGTDARMDFSTAESVIAVAGKRILSTASRESCVFVLDWDLEAQGSMNGVTRLPL